MFRWGNFIIDILILSRKNHLKSLFLGGWGYFKNLFAPQNEPIFLKGLRFGQQKTIWPWDKGIVIKALDEFGNERSINFDSSKLYLDSNFKVTNIIDDSGASILASLEEKNE